MVFGEQSYAAMDVVGLLYDVKSGHRRPAPRGTQDRGQHAYRCRFSGTVGTEQGEDLSGADAQRHSVYRDQITEILAQVMGFNQWTTRTIRAL
jgi:hypothetical protein